MRRFLFLLHLATGLAALGDVQTVVVDADTSELVYPTDLFSVNSASLIEAIPWGDVHATGTTAERPACGAPNFGFLYANTTTGTIQICSEIGWSDWFVVSGSSHNHDGVYVKKSGDTVAGTGLTIQGDGLILKAPYATAPSLYIPVWEQDPTTSGSRLVARSTTNLFLDLGGHDASRITTGKLSIQRLDISGTPDGTKFLLDTGEWAAVPGGLADAPSDGKFYGRKTNTWVSPTTFTGYGITGGVISNTITLNNRALLGFMKFKGQSTNSTDEFWKIATIQPSSDAQSATLFVRAIGGSVSAANKYVIELLVANRNGNQFSYWLKGTRSIGSGIKVYEEANGSLSVYGWLTGTNNQYNGWGIDAWMGNWENPASFTSQVYQDPQLVTEPTGTLVFDSTTSDPLVHMPNTGNPLVGTNVIWHAGNLDPNQFAGTNHTHTASQITSGVFDANRLGSGLAATNSVLIASPGAPPNWGKIGTSSLGALDYVDLRAGTNVVRMSVVQVGEVFTLQLIKQ